MDCIFGNTNPFESLVLVYLHNCCLSQSLKAFLLFIINIYLYLVIFYCISSIDALTEYKLGTYYIDSTKEFNRLTLTIKFPVDILVDSGFGHGTHAEFHYGLYGIIMIIKFSLPHNLFIEEKNNEISLYSAIVKHLLQF